MPDQKTIEQQEAVDLWLTQNMPKTRKIYSNKGPGIMKTILIYVIILYCTFCVSLCTGQLIADAYNFVSRISITLEK